MSYDQAIKKARRRRRLDQLAVLFFAVLIVIVVGSAVAHAISPLPENLVESAVALGVTSAALSLTCFLMSDSI